MRNYFKKSSYRVIFNKRDGTKYTRGDLLKIRISLLFSLIFILGACSLGPAPASVDTTAPVLTIHSPWWGQQLPTQYTLSVEVDEPDCEIFYSISYSSFTSLGTISGQGNFILNQPSGQSNIIRVYAVDPSGLHSLTNNMLIVWAAVPGVSITAPHFYALYNGASIDITGTAFVDSPGAILDISLSTDQGSSFFTIGSVADWVYNILLNEGTNHILARVVSSDYKTNYSSAVTYFVDNMTPMLSITTPLSETVTSDSTFTLSGTAWDIGLAGIKNISISIDGSAYSPFSILSNWSKTITLHPGANQIDIIARDNAGNVSGVETRIINNMIIDKNGMANDQFGTSVSVSSNGRTMAVGVPSAMANRGYIAIFEMQSGKWVQVAKKTVSVISPTNYLGSIIDLSADGNTLVAGVPAVKRAFIFEKGSGWTNGTETVQLSSLSVNLPDQFAKSISVSGNGSTIALGTPLFSSIFPNQGAVLIYTRPTTGWTNMNHAYQLIQASDAVGGEQFGTSVSISANGKTVVAGAPFAVLTQGALYVITNFNISSASIKLNGNSLLPNSYLGMSCHIAPSGGVIFGGARGFNSDTGKVLVYTPGTDAKWYPGGQVADLDSPFSSGARMGSALNSDWWGTVLLAGAPEKQIGSFNLQGAVYLFQRQGPIWASQNLSHYYVDSYGKVNDYFGSSIGVDKEARNIYVGIKADFVVSNTAQGSVFHYTR